MSTPKFEVGDPVQLIESTGRFVYAITECFRYQGVYLYRLNNHTRNVYGENDLRHVDTLRRVPRSDFERDVANAVDTAAMACGATLTADQTLFLTQAALDASERAIMARALETFAEQIPMDVHDPRHIADLARTTARTLRGQA